MATGGGRALRARSATVNYSLETPVKWKTPLRERERKKIPIDVPSPDKENFPQSQAKREQKPARGKGPSRSQKARPPGIGGDEGGLEGTRASQEVASVPINSAETSKSGGAQIPLAHSDIRDAAAVQVPTSTSDADNQADARPLEANRVTGDVTKEQESKPETATPVVQGKKKSHGRKPLRGHHENGKGGLMKTGKSETEQRKLRGDHNDRHAALAKAGSKGKGGNRRGADRAGMVTADSGRVGGAEQGSCPALEQGTQGTAEASQVRRQALAAAGRAVKKAKQRREHEPAEEKDGTLANGRTPEKGRMPEKDRPPEDEGEARGVTGVKDGAGTSTQGQGGEGGHKDGKEAELRDACASLKRPGDLLILDEAGPTEKKSKASSEEEVCNDVELPASDAHLAAPPPVLPPGLGLVANPPAPVSKAVVPPGPHSSAWQLQNAYDKLKSKYQKLKTLKLEETNRLFEEQKKKVAEYAEASERMARFYREEAEQLRTVVIQSRLPEKEALIGRLTEENAELQETLLAGREKVLKQGQKQMELEMRVTDAEKGIAEAKATIDRLVAEKAEAERARAVADEARVTVQNAMETNSEAVKLAIGALEERVASERARAEQALAEASSLRSQHETVGEEAKKAMARAVKQMAEMKARMEGAEATARTAQERVEAAEAAARAAQERVEAADAAARSTQERVQAAEAAAEDVITELRAAVAVKEEENDAVIKEATKLRERAARLEGELKERVEQQRQWSSFMEMLTGFNIQVVGDNNATFVHRATGFTFKLHPYSGDEEGDADETTASMALKTPGSAKRRQSLGPEDVPDDLEYVPLALGRLETALDPAHEIREELSFSFDMMPNFLRHIIKAIKEDGGM